MIKKKDVEKKNQNLQQPKKIETKKNKKKNFTN